MSGQNYEKQLVALGRALQMLREEEDTDVLIEKTLAFLHAEFDYELVWIGLYNRTTHRLMGRGGITPNGEVGILVQEFALEPGDILEQVVIQQRPVGVPDLREEARSGKWRKVAQKLDIQGSIVFPIRHRDICLGVALLGSKLWGVSAQSDDKARLSMLLGGLGAALYQTEMNLQRQRTTHPATPLLSLLSGLRSLPSVDDRLACITLETHQFLSADRTHLYWYEAAGRRFWHRAGQPGNRRSPDRHPGRNGPPAAPDIYVEQANSFYQALAAGQLITVGEAGSSLSTELTGKLMQAMQGQSLLAAPVLFEDELLGFLAVEGNEARIWSDDEKTYMRGAANLAALVSPLESSERQVEQVKVDQALVAEVSRALYSEDDWHQVLIQCGNQLCERLEAERFLVLTYDESQEKFSIVHQCQPNGQAAVPGLLATLNDIDWQMLERSKDTVSIEDLNDNLKLMAWRDRFLDLGIRSLLVCSTSLGNPLHGIVVVGHRLPRTWSRIERNLVRIVSQQIGLVLRQWQLQNDVQQQHGFYDAIRYGLEVMQRTAVLVDLEQSSVSHIADLLEVPLVALLTWQPGQKEAKITAIAICDHRFGVNTDQAISIYTDQLVQWTLQSDGIYPVSSANLTPETRRWLCGTEIGQILTIALRTSTDYAPTGMLVIADAFERFWSEQQLNMLEILSLQLAWSRRHLMLTTQLAERQVQLEQLNWYKHRRIEELCRNLNSYVKRLNDLSHQKDALASMRYHQVVRQLGDLLTTANPVLRLEHWQLHHSSQSISLVSLVKRGMERVEPLIRQRQLWSQVHNDSNVDIGGDIAKIELVLHELLSLACRRSPQGGRLDVWCRPLDFHWLEISITDQGMVEARMLEELHGGRFTDLLMPSTLDHPPGLHLLICQSLVQQLGGDLELYRLEDGRILSRLVLAIATGDAQPPRRPPPLKT
ncbi:MAG: GAF domain-containing protein [Synechococcales bacterium]|nr:GAF domain-containing protein [Synechococcales bacterium]